MLLAFNRLGVSGDLDFAVVNGRVDVARTGSDYELVPGANDNNLIGTGVLAVWHAWTVFRTRELTLIRLLNGLVFVEQVSGHPGSESSRPQARTGATEQRGRNAQEA